MRQILTIIFLGFNIMILHSQNFCNRDFSGAGEIKEIPKEVCIPMGYEIRYTYEPVDVDNDGLKDFIFSWEKKQLKDGDTIYISVYKMNTDSTYSFLKTFNNLYPIFFKSYDNCKICDKRFYEICERYGGYPLREFTFFENGIKIMFKDNTGGSHAGIILTYKYNKEKNNWYLEKKETWLERESVEIERVEKIEEEISIDEFNYLDCLEY